MNISISLASGAAQLGKGLREAAGQTTIQQRTDLPTLIGSVIGSVLTVIGVLFFILSVYGGFLWMTARGNEQEVTKGKNTLIAAIIGVIIVMASYAVTSLVLRSTRSTGAESTSGVVETSQRCRDLGVQKGGNWECKLIDECDTILTAVGSSQMSREEKRDACGRDPAQCALDICGGGPEIVCCR